LSHIDNVLADLELGHNTRQDIVQ